MIPTPYLDELRRLCKEAEDYAADNAEQLDAEKKLIEEARRRAQQTQGGIRALERPTT